MHTVSTSKTQQSGFAHLGLIVAVVGVLAIGGLVAWRFMGAKDSSDATSSISNELAKKIAAAKCDYADKDLCKFFVSWKEHKSYKMTSSSTDKASGKASSMTYEINGDDSHMIMTGDYASESITIGTTAMYTKTPNGVWWKQTLTQTDTPQDESTKPDVSFTEPSEETKDDTPKPEYKALGKEACGSLTCFKYQVIYPGESDSTEYFWFDTKSYQLRRMLSESAEVKSDMSFSYDNVTVKAPTTYKELAPNQYIMPGQNEPTTVPTFGN